MYPQAFSIRAAELRDIPRITSVCLASFPDDPAFNYLWRYRRQYPEDSYFFWMGGLKATLYDPTKIFLVAVESKTSAKPHVHEDRGEALETIVAFAVWERNDSTRSPIWSYLLLQDSAWNLLHRLLTKVENWAIAREFKRRDGDWTRVIAYAEAMKRVHAQYWETKHPQNYRLELLATHPDYRRRGAGSLLTQWGINQGTAAGIPIGVEASPMGYPLYLHLGFTLLETVVVQPEGDDASASFKVMVCQGRGKS